MKTSLKTNNNIYCPLLPEDVTFCELDECGDIALWICYPQDVLVPAIPLCDRCKQEMVRDDMADLQAIHASLFSLLLDLSIHLTLSLVIISLFKFLLFVLWTIFSNFKG